MRYEPVPPTRCICLCHDGSIGDRFRADGVDVRDIIEAAVACDRCRKYHVYALLSDRDANAPQPRIIQPRETTEWVDVDPVRPPPIPDDPSEDGN